METTEKLRYHQAILDEHVSMQFEEIRGHVAINAENYATRNQPPPQNKKVHTYFEEDHLKYQALIDEVNRQLQFQTIVHQVAEHKKVTDNKLREVHNEQSHAKEKEISIDAQLQRKKPPFSRLRMPFVWMATIIICLFDGILAVPVFETWGYSLAEALVMGLLFGFALAVIAHVYEKIVSFGKTALQQRIIAVTVLLLLILLFYTMASHRAEYLEQQVSEDALQTIHFSPWPFALISLLLFIAAVTIHYFYYPSHEQRAVMREYQKLAKAKRDNESEQRRLKEQNAAIEHEHVKMRHMNASVLEYGSSLEDLIISRAHEGFALWKKRNVMHRKDNCRPLSFDEPGYPLQFTTNFHSVKTLQ